MRTALLLTYGTTFLVLLGCAGLGGDSKDGDTTDEPGLLDDHDVDGDGYSYDDDCDDDDGTVHPGAPEICDAADVDEDCNGLSDNADPGLQGGFVYFHDADGDGYGDGQAVVTACEPTAGYVTISGDCDDTDAAINPSAIEICDDHEVDEDCNDLADDDDPYVDPSGEEEFNEDRDGDGFGDPDLVDSFCHRPDGWVGIAQDCDDVDADVNPDAIEICDGIDDDCDGVADPDDAGGATDWYADTDGDGYGDADASRSACSQPDGYVEDASDCDDTRGNTNPAASEICDGDDDDCDGTIDESDARNASTWYRDSDGDTYGDDTVTTVSCDQPFGYVAIDGDCNDATAAINPGKDELCDSADVDEDCDGNADDDDWSVLSTGKTTYYADSDGDTYGDPDNYDTFCDLPASGYVADDTDCDDSSSAVNPGATEICDSRDTDEDCDDLADDDDSSVSAAGKSTYYRDADGDGYGTTATTTTACDLPTGYSTSSTDCDDTTALRDPGNSEVCDAADLDEDCDSLSDDNDSSVLVSSKTSWYIDADGDGYGDDGATGTAKCNQPAGYVSSKTDCDDADATISPAATEICSDTIDQDCDGTTACSFTIDDASRELIGENASDYAGSGLGAAGDQDGDGYDDIVVGAYGSDLGGSTSGAAYVVKGGASLTDVDLSAATAILTGEDASDSAGGAVAGAGDINADGKGDVLVGAIGDDDGGTDAGKVYVLRGPVSSIDLSSAYRRLIGENAGDYAGCDLAGASDVNADGYDDVLVGASGRSSSAGGAYLVTSFSSSTIDLSTATAIMTGETSADYAGASVDMAGDVNGDGYDDMIVGAYKDDDAGTDAGAAYIILGPQTGTASLSTADAKIKGPSSSDYLGHEVSGAGDVDGDGYDDVLVGAYGYTYPTAWLVSGPVTGVVAVSSVADATFTGASSSYFGDAMDGGGDVDGDGKADVLIGSYGTSSSAGAAYLYFGPLSGSLSYSSADLTVTSTTASDYLGYRVSFVGDHDGDGQDDFALGAYGEDDGGSAAGAVWVFLSSAL